MVQRKKAKKKRPVLKMRDHLRSIDFSLQVIRGAIAGINNSSGIEAENQKLRLEIQRLHEVMFKTPKD